MRAARAAGSRLTLFQKLTADYRVLASTPLDSRLMLHMWVDWPQRTITQVELLLTLSSDNATYETQFGWMQHPTHKNTTWARRQRDEPLGALLNLYNVAPGATSNACRGHMRQMHVVCTWSIIN
ncbi:hypothetical protein B0H14DRAFT_2592991 [Mycena olivaceomarginata]|nr:hypothetical protein B0H14DRAFT_2592991 [Mycena olivaceomarginata]